MLASGSLDSTVRLWRFQTPRTYTDDRQFHVEEKRLSVGGKLLAVSLESVLLGHEGRVYSVHWHPPTPSKGENRVFAIILLTLVSLVLDEPRNRTAIKSHIETWNSNSGELKTNVMS